MRDRFPRRHRPPTPRGDQCLVRSSTKAGEVRFELGLPLLDRYFEFVAGRTRATLRAVTFDLKMFFCVVDLDPVEVNQKWS